MEVKSYLIIRLEGSYILKNKFKIDLNIDDDIDPGNLSVIDASLDLFQIQKNYRNNFVKGKINGVDYTLTLVNVSFEHTYKFNGKVQKIKSIRKQVYKNGFDLNGNHYVRYKRTAGSSREGKCLFIIDGSYDNNNVYHQYDLHKKMLKWGEECLKLDKSLDELAAYEAYRALSLSSICSVIDIPLESILFVKDYDVIIKDEVINIKNIDDSSNIQAQAIDNGDESEIKNTLWDGESLLDESLFDGDFKDKHMLLLRNKFFKSCAFKTKLQRWFLDNNITDIKQLNGITFAKDIKDIKMVTTDTSLKFLKFMKGKFNRTNLETWVKHADQTFGVVKYDKRTKFFNGMMVQSNYQLLNTIDVCEEGVKTIVENHKEFIGKLRDNINLLSFYFSDIIKPEESIFNEEDNYKLVTERKANILFKIMKINDEFQNTKLYRDEVINEFVEDYKNKMLRGNLLFDGTYATIFGNGPSLLLYIINSKSFDEYNHHLQPYTIYSNFFNDNEEILCARSPHITMGNLYLAKNDLNIKYYDYFDLGKYIVGVNAYNDNLQQRLNGCDYDSDTMLLTNDSILVNSCKKNFADFLVPVNNINKGTKSNYTEYYEIDHVSANNLVGDITNFSQRLNSIYWDKYHQNADINELKDIYKDICILAVLSGIEIDKVKRSYNVNVSNELTKLQNKYSELINNRPLFFERMDQETFDKYIDDEEEKEKKMQDVKYSYKQTPMDLFYQTIKSISYRGKKKKYTELENLFDFSKVEKSTDINLNRNTRTIIDKLNEKNNLINKKQRQYFVVKEEKIKFMFFDLLKQLEQEKKELIQKKVNSEVILKNIITLSNYDKTIILDLFNYVDINIIKNVIVKQETNNVKYIFAEDGEIKLFNIGIKNIQKN